MSEWQPISTAPKDRYIIVFNKNTRAYIAIWVQNPFNGDEDWSVGNLGHGNRTLVGTPAPTHWYPVPNPPTFINA